MKIRLDTWRPQQRSSTSGDRKAKSSIQIIAAKCYESRAANIIVIPSCTTNTFRICSHISDTIHIKFVPNVQIYNALKWISESFKSISCIIIKILNLKRSREQPMRLRNIYVLLPSHLLILLLSCMKISTGWSCKWTMGGYNFLIIIWWWKYIWYLQHWPLPSLSKVGFRVFIQSWIESIPSKLIKSGFGVETQI